LIKGLNIKLLIPKMATLPTNVQQPKGMQYTDEQRDKSLKAHRYNRVGEKASNLSLSGAPNRWKKAEWSGTVPDIYVPSVRLAGNPTLIRQVLLNAGVDPTTIARHIAGAYTKDNYNTTMKAQYDAEVAAYKAWKKQNDAAKKAKAVAAYSLADLVWIAEGLATAKAVDKDTKAKTATSPGRGRVRPLVTRLTEVNTKPGMVLDVSKMDLVKGTGVKTTKAPKAGSTKIMVGDLRIVSDNPHTYAAALRQLPASDDIDPEQYIASFNQAYVGRTQVAQATAAALVGAGTAVPQARSPTATVGSPTGL
jgi:hypothetical protein